MNRKTLDLLKKVRVVHSHYTKPDSQDQNEQVAFDRIADLSLIVTKRSLCSVGEGRFRVLCQDYLAKYDSK